MIKIVNCLNDKWNQLVSWFHNASTRTGIKWLIRLSVWVYDRLLWHLSDEWQLVNGITLKEYKLRHELEMAHHKIQYYANYAYDLQCRILEEKQSRLPRNSSNSRKKENNPPVETV